MNVKRIWKWYNIAVFFLVGVIAACMVGFVALVALNVDREATIFLGVAIGWPIVVAFGLLAVICWIINTKRPWEPDSKLRDKASVLGLTAGLLIVGAAVLLLLWPDRGGGNGAHTVILVAQTVVLAITAGFVVWYAHAAHRQAEILKDQFDVQSTPHLRPDVFGMCGETNYVGIRLRNLAGAAAIHPGVYPEWTKPHENNAELVREPSLLAEGDYFTCPVIQVGETWFCRALIPPGDSGKVVVRWLEQPWAERHKHEHIWTLQHNPEKKNEWHFVYEP